MAYDTTIQSCLICLSTSEECSPTRNYGVVDNNKKRELKEKTGLRKGIEQNGTGKNKTSFEKELLADHLRVVFLLKNLLQIPNETLTNYLENWGSPVEWIRLCDNCDTMVQKAWENYQRILVIMRKFAGVRNTIVEKVRTARVYRGCSNRAMTMGLITGEVRGFVKAKLYSDVTITHSFQSGNLEDLPLISPKQEVVFDHYDDFEDIQENSLLFDDDNDVKWQLDDEDNEESCNETINEEEYYGNSDDADRESYVPDKKRIKSGKKDDSFDCKFCGKQYASEHGLSIHLGRSHGDETRSDTYVCKVEGCGKEFKWRQSFHDHMAKHRNEFRFKCNICGKEFFKSNKFKKHMEVHKRNTIQTTLTGGKRGPGRRPDIYGEKLHSPAKTSDSDSSDTDPAHQKGNTSTTKISEKEKSYKQNSPSALPKKRKDQQKIICTEEGCGKEFSWIQSYKTHMASIHRQERRFECEQCGKKFYKASGLRIHSKSHGLILKTIPAAATLGDSSNRLENIFPHELIFRAPHASDKEWKCTDCGNVYDSKQSLGIHIGLKHEELRKTQTLVCCVEGCGKVYQLHKRQHYQLHMAKHRKETKFRCSLCEKEFYVKRDFLHHKQAHKRKTIRSKMKSESTESTVNDTETDESYLRPYNCELCGKRFATDQTLRRHMLKAKVHLPATNEQLTDLKCKHCGREFQTKSTLTYHESTHDTQNGNLKSFQCDHCGKGFRNKGHLTLHIKSHVGPAPKRQLSSEFHICDLCGMRFRRLEYLRTHKRFVHEKKWVVYCKLCAKGFRCQQHLRLHMRISHKIFEDGVKVFKCTVQGCMLRFFDEQRYKDHTQKYHPNGGEGDPHPFTCHKCGRGFWIIARLNAHLSRHERVEGKSQKKQDSGTN